MQHTEPWVKSLEREIVEVASERKPYPPSFPLDVFGSMLSKLFNNNITLSIGSCEEQEEKSFFQGLGSSPLTFSFHLTPLKGDIFWIMPLEDVKKLVSWRKDQKGEALELENPELIKALYRFTQGEILSLLSSLEIYKGLSPKMTEKASLPEQAYAIDISLSKDTETLWGRMLLSPLFQRSFTNHFATKREHLADLGDYREIPIPLSLTAGTLELTQEELASLDEGDFVRIDSTTYHPKSRKGSLKLYLQDLPLFQVKYKEESYKIFDILYPYQESTS
jgi:hypothetical protein